MLNNLKRNVGSSKNPDGRASDWQLGTLRDVLALNLLDEAGTARVVTALVSGTYGSVYPLMARLEEFVNAQHIAAVEPPLNAANGNGNIDVEAVKAELVSAAEAACVAAGLAKPTAPAPRKRASRSKAVKV